MFAKVLAGFPGASMEARPSTSADGSEGKDVWNVWQSKSEIVAAFF